METIGFMFAGYMVIWALAFGFLFSIWTKSKRLEKELIAVRQLVDDLERRDR